MALQDKYAELLQTARNMGIANLATAEDKGVLHVSGTANSSADYDALWSLYERIDPGMASGDLLMNIDVKANAGSRIKITTDSSNLNIRSSPTTEAEIIGKAAHGEIVTLVEKTNDSWWKIRTNEGEEGYAYTQYLSPE